LDDEHPFTIGIAPEGFLDVLKARVAGASIGSPFLGVHQCELCNDPWAVGSDNIMFVRKGLRYIAPELIVHYVEAHCYLPPPDFVAAVLNRGPFGLFRVIRRLLGYPW
jgi:hypothetical protein